MTIEHSHGKARPTLVRASDLQPTDAAEKPMGERAEHGHFAEGNRIGLAARFKHTLRKALGSAAAPGEAGIAARDGRRIFSHTLPTLPSAAAPVQSALSLHARHLALFNYYSARAERAGLDTEEGMKFQAVADRQSQRAERCLVTTEDIARIHAVTPEGAIDASVERDQKAFQANLARQQKAKP